MFGAIGTLISVGGSSTRFHVWNRAVFLFDGGFIHVQRPGEPPDVFTWPDIVKVCKRVSVREIGAWRSYTEVDRHLKDGHVAEQWFAKGQPLRAGQNDGTWPVLLHGLAAGRLHDLAQARAP